MRLMTHQERRGLRERERAQHLSGLRERRKQTIMHQLDCGGSHDSNNLAADDAPRERQERERDITISE